MKIADYIWILVSEHDCVVIPRLGAFVSTNVPAKVLFHENSFVPPTRMIKFIERLQHDDNLVVDYISLEESISTEEARIRLEYFIKGVRVSIDRGDSVPFPHLGKLIPTDNGEIDFVANKSLDLNPESFGFDRFVSPAISREFRFSNVTGMQKSGSRSYENYLDKTSQTYHIARSKRVYWTGNLRRTMLKVASLVLLFTVLGSLILVSNPSKQGLNSSMSTVFSFDMHFPSSFVKMWKRLDNLPSTDSEGDQLNEQRVEDMGRHFLGSGPQINPIGDHKRFYFLIAGSFFNRKNAVRFASELKRKGYQSEVISFQDRGPFRVSYAYVQGKFNALDLLTEIRNHENPSAWLLYDN